MKKRWADFGLIFLLVAIIIIYFYPLFLPYPQVIANPDFGRSDVFHMSISTKYFYWQKLQQNQLPLWSSKIGTGFPVLGEGQIGAFFLPNLILYKWSPFITAYNISLIFPILLFAIGFYFWFKISWNFSKLISFYGALIFSFSGIVMTHLTHITLLQSLSCMPWVLLFTSLLHNNKSFKNIFLLAFFLSQQILAGFVQAAFITLLFSGFYYLYLNKFNYKKIKNYFYFIMSICFGFILSAIQILPSMEFLQNTTDKNGFSLADASYFSYPFKQLIAFLNPFALGNPKFGTYPSFTQFSGSIFWENTGYLGLLPLVFAAYYIFSKKNHKKEFYFLLITLFMSFLLMTGTHSPLYLLYDFWPLNLFRVPSRFIWIFCLMLMVLSLKGLAKFLKIFKSHNIKYLIFLLISLFSLWQLWYSWSNYNSYARASDWMDKPEVTAYLKKDSRVIDYGIEELHNQTFLTTGWTSLSPYLFLKNSLYPNSNLIWGYYTYNASVGRLLYNKSLVDSIINYPTFGQDNKIYINDTASEMLNLAAVDKIITPYEISDSKQFVKINQLKNQQQILNVYDNLLALPRAYLVPNSVKADFPQMLNIISQKGFVPGNQVFINQNIKLNSSGKIGQAKIISDNDDKIVIDISDNETDAFLVLADTYYPGWTAALDGKSTPIYQANINQKTIVVPAGNHYVVFEYKPKYFFYGTVITACGYAMMLIYGVYRMFR